MADRKPNAPPPTAAPPYAGPSGPAMPPQAGLSLTQDYVEPPPSYEDAMADNVPANAQGPRDGYRPPPPKMTDVWADEKRR
jgi:hypothetical protein